VKTVKLTLRSRLYFALARSAGYPGRTSGDWPPGKSRPAEQKRIGGPRLVDEKWAGSTLDRQGAAVAAVGVGDGVASGDAGAAGAGAANGDSGAARTETGCSGSASAPAAPASAGFSVAASVDGASVGATVAVSVGISVGVSVGASVGTVVGVAGTAVAGIIVAVGGTGVGVDSPPLPQAISKSPAMATVRIRQERVKLKFMAMMEM
jgi:hypothetical protein